MRRKKWLILVLLGVLSLAVLLVGIFMGDAGLVLENASAICFT